MGKRQDAQSRRPVKLFDGMAGTTGLEPATSAVTGQRSNQLNYVPTRQINQMRYIQCLCGFARFAWFALAASPLPYKSALPGTTAPKPLQISGQIIIAWDELALTAGRKARGKPRHHILTASLSVRKGAAFFRDSATEGQYFQGQWTDVCSPMG